MPTDTVKQEGLTATCARAAERIIRREGGKITLTSLEATGLTLVTLSLPEPLTPQGESS